MDTLHRTERNRTELSFTLDGLGDREQTLFKSFVRLVDHRTMHHWTSVPAGGQLRVVGPQHPLAADKTSGNVLVLGGTAGARHQLPLPIHADALEAVLNDIGAWLADTAAPQHHDAPAGLDDQVMVRLTRWPTPELLTTRERIRLATLMTGRPMSLADASLRCGIRREECAAFAAALVRSGMLVTVGPAQAPRIPHTAPPAAGLIARIRSRLGLSPAFSGAAR